MEVAVAATKRQSLGLLLAVGMCLAAILRSDKLGACRVLPALMMVGFLGLACPGRFIVTL